MRITIAVVVASVVFLGCTDTLWCKRRQAVVDVYPSSKCSRMGYSCALASDFWKEYGELFKSRDDALNFFRRMGPTTKEIEDALRDPFVCSNLYSVTLESNDPARDIASYYSKQFKTKGWDEVREGLFIEETNAGGDWVRVYKNSKGGKVLIHIIGPWANEDQRKGDTVSPIRLITFRFLECTVDEFFGADNLNVLKSESSANSVSRRSGHGP